MESRVMTAMETRMKGPAPAAREKPAGERAVMNNAAARRGSVSLRGPGRPETAMARPAVTSVIQPDAQARERATAKATPLKAPFHLLPAAIQSDARRAPITIVTSAKVVPLPGITAKAAVVPVTAARALAAWPPAVSFSSFHLSGASSFTYHRERSDTGIMSIR